MRQALGGLAHLSQFFIYKLTPHSEIPGKFHKVPWRNGNAHGVENAEHWLSMDAAESVLSDYRRDGQAYTLGFAITSGCGYWFADIDHSIGEGRFTAIGEWSYNLFPGAFYEVSSSGTGFHLIGRGVVPEHSSRDDARGIEFYTESRGIAFGLSGVAYGSADTDHTHALNTVWCPQLFPPKPKSEHGSGPRVEWRGPTDDAELLRRALKSGSIASTFGSRATFADLWENNIAALALAYPDPGKPDGVERTSADMALAMHLTFWTGCDAARIERLMRRSGLARIKWDEHRTYLRELTIEGACARATVVLQEKLPEPVAGIEPGDDAARVSIAAEVILGDTYLTPENQIGYFEGCVYIVDDHKVFSPIHGGMLLSPAQFNSAYGGRAFVLNNVNQGAPSKQAFECFTQSQAITFPKVKGTTFRPDLEPASVIKIGGVSYLNSYVSSPIVATAGDVSLFTSHIANLFPVANDQAILIAYFAALIQHRGVKFRWCPVLQGNEGCGKGLIFKAIRSVVGARYSYSPRAKQLAGQFNDWIDERLLITIDEIRIDRKDFDTLDVLKPMISDDDIESEGKGLKKKMVNNFANFLMSTNHKDAMSTNVGGRRFANFFSALQTEADVSAAGMDARYFERLADWIGSDAGVAALAHWLQSYPIPDVLNPATGCIRAPHTSSDAEMREVSLGVVEQAVQDAIQEGRPGFCGGWICIRQLKVLLREIGRQNMTGPKMADMLMMMGYVFHPRLVTKGWTDNAVPQEGNKRVRLFVRDGHPSMYLSAPAEIVHNYVDQNYGNAIVPNLFLVKP